MSESVAVMAGRPQTMRSLWPLFVLVLALLTPRSAWAAPFDLSDTGWEGMKGLVELAKEHLGNSRVVTTEAVDWGSLTVKDGLLIIHPERTVDGEELAAFLRSGGRAAVVDDYGLGDRILQRYGVRRGPAPKDPVLTLRSNSQIALAEPVRESSGGKVIGVHPVVADVSRVVTNHPTTLSHPDLSVVLRIRARDESDAVLAVAGQVGKGRLFALGDPSSLMNLMLRYPGNRALGEGLIKYLVDDDSWGSRQGKLVIVSNRFNETGAFAGSASSRELRELARSLETEVRKIESEGLPKPVAYALAALCTALLGVWAYFVGGKRYSRPLPRIASGVPVVAQGGVAGRAAVLAAPTTHRGLILLEQKSALEEKVGVLLGAKKTPTMTALLQELEEKSLLDPDTFRALRSLFLDMAHVETAVLAGSPIRVTVEQLRHAEQVTQRVCEALESKLHRLNQS